MLCRKMTTCSITTALIVSTWLTPPSIASAQEGTDGAPQFGEGVQSIEHGGAVSEDATGDGVPEQEDGFADLSLEELMEVQVVVTPTRHEQKITNVPYAISVVTADDIRASGARSIPDALRLVPGVDVAQITSGNAAVSLRGMHGFLSGQTLVLVDGRQIYDAGSGGTFWFAWPFQLEDIERIEVIRGPGGVAWGANAVNGVINIITKDPTQQLGLTLTTTVASRDTYGQHVGYAFQDGPLRMRVSAEYEGTAGFKNGGSLLFPLDDEYDAWRLGIRAIYEPGPQDTWAFSAGYSLIEDGFPPSLTTGFDPTNASHQTAFLLAKWDHRMADDSSFSFTAFINDFFGHPGIRSIDYRYQQLGLQFGHVFSPSERHTLTWGLDTRLDLMNASNSDPQFLSKDHVSSGVVGLYAQDEWRFAPKWTLNAGGRIEYDSYGGFQPSARVALSYELSGDSIIYGAVSRAFQMVPGAQRFLQFPIIDGLATVESRRSRDPTQLLAYEIGYRGRFFDRLSASLTLFWHEYDDLGAFTPTLGLCGPTLFWNSNARASLYGMEFDARYALSEKLTLLGNYTFERLDWRYPVSFSPATDFVEPPRHKAMLGARYSATDRFHLSTHLYYVDAVRAPNPSFPLVSQHIDQYFRLDLRAEYELLTDRAWIAVGASNLLDSGHFEGASVHMNDGEVPRMIFAEFRLRIK